MELNFMNNRVDIWTRSRGEYSMTIKNSWIMRHLNRILHQYPDEYNFKPGDEPVFKFNSNQIKRIRSEIPFLGKILAQITGGIS